MPEMDYFHLLNYDNVLLSFVLNSLELRVVVQTNNLNTLLILGSREFLTGYFVLLHSLYKRKEDNIVK